MAVGILTVLFSFALTCIIGYFCHLSSPDTTNISDPLLRIDKWLVSNKKKCLIALGTFKENVFDSHFVLMFVRERCFYGNSFCTFQHDDNKICQGPNRRVISCSRTLDHFTNSFNYTICWSFQSPMTQDWTLNVLFTIFISEKPKLTLGLFLLWEDITRNLGCYCIRVHRKI